MTEEYRPPKVSGEFKKGASGLARVRVNQKKRLVQILFEDGKKFTFRRTKDVAKLVPGKWYVQLNSDETEIFSFRPYVGHFKGFVSEFVGGEDGPVPKTREYTNKEGHTYSITSFSVLIEITEPKNCAGIVVPYNLRYNFREATDDKGRSVVGLPDRGRHSKTLEEFLDITGAWESGPAKYTDNVLPDFERRILRAERKFNFIIKDGYIDTIYQLEDADPTSDVWEDDVEDVPETVVVDDEFDLNWDEE